MPTIQEMLHKGQPQDLLRASDFLTFMSLCSCFTAVGILTSFTVKTREIPFSRSGRGSCCLGGAGADTAAPGLHLGQHCPGHGGNDPQAKALLQDSDLNSDPANYSFQKE